ncbi:hypothetical protein SEA_PRAIRIE_55 [Arthrobacter phage Prairie]|uniref:Uncharacterized protein n=1 Tax=Arthrobacter phage Prairie TaxID=2816463 RepID=A0A8A5LRR2_9CAUD|nr:hypothetical protein SEA_PRAIRIE_55 [Arthrobacter phage Prairie]
MNPAPDRPRLSINWNGGYRGGRRIVNNVLFGASYTYYPGYPSRTLRAYLGLWTATLEIPVGGPDA